MLKKYAIPTLFTLTAFVGASLIFVVQPLISSLLLPAYGGAATVWTTASFFFQVVLLMGYLIVHGATRLGPKIQPFTQIPLVLIALFLLPLAVPTDASPEGHEPGLWLVKTLLVMIGLPFLVLSTTGPLMQKWYSWTGSIRSDDPYFIYAASNVGSFLGLLAYPFLIEPNISRADQRTLWSYAFYGFIVLVAICGVIVLKKASSYQAAAATKVKPSKLTFKEQAWWVLLAAIPSSLMLGATTFITTDVAPIPLLWVVPLAIYLATMIYAFGRTSRKKPMGLIYGAITISVLALLFTFSPQSYGIWLDVAMALAALAVIATACHVYLATERPNVEHLTRYFLLISLGGAIGGGFNSFIAPLIFPKPFEYPLLLALTPLLLMGTIASRKAIGLLLLTMLSSIVIRDAQLAGDADWRDRTFYGSYSVKDLGDRVQFTHGTTAHGTQMKDAPEEPTTYYTRLGPLGNVFEATDPKKITGVGLGVGTIASYGEKDMEFHMVEIDQRVLDVAEDEKFFTYLKDTKAQINHTVGDGRLAVEKDADKSRDLIILDAFSSDSIPVHLLTAEAMKEYQAKLTDDGVIAVHISNRVFDLVPVIMSAADELGYTGLLRSYVPDYTVDKYGSGTTWMVLAPEGEVKDELLAKDWIVPDAKRVKWTDDYSSVLQVLAW